MYTLAIPSARGLGGPKHVTSYGNFSDCVFAYIDTGAGAGGGYLPGAITGNTIAFNGTYSRPGQGNEFSSPVFTSIEPGPAGGAYAGSSVIKIKGSGVSPENFINPGNGQPYNYFLTAIGTTRASFTVTPL
jgi:hypothetical protein